MKTRNLLFVMVIVVSWTMVKGQDRTTYDYSTPPDWNWAEQFGGSGADNASDVTTDENGNIYITGSFSGEVYIGADTITSNGKWDAFTAKYNSSGNLLWFRQYQASAPENGLLSNAITRDYQGFIYITGYYTGWVELGNYTLPDYNPDGKNFFYARLEENGNVIVAGNPNLPMMNFGICIKTDNLGNIFIIGANLVPNTSNTLVCFNNTGDLIWNYQSEASFYDLEIYNGKVFYSGTIYEEGYIGNFFLDPSYTSDAFLARSDLGGNFEWAYIPTHDYTSGYSQGFTLYLDESGNIYQCGYFVNDVIFGTTQLTSNYGFVVKADQDCNYEWASACYRVSDICGNSDLAVIYGSTGALTKLDCLTGQWLNYIYPNCTPDRLYYCNATDRVITSGDLELLAYISAFDTDLNQLMLEQIDGNSGYGHNIGTATDHQGYFYAFSYASNDMDYFGVDVHEGLILSKHDLSGNMEWLWQFQGAIQSATYGCYIQVDELHNCLYVTGVFTEPFIIPGITTLIPGEGGSFYIMKFDLEGNFTWVIQEDAMIYGNCLTVDHSGNVLLSGTFYGIMPIGNVILEGAGGDDAFIAKYNSGGDFDWAVRGGGEDMEYVSLISTDQDDNIYLTGEFTSVDVTLGDHSIILEEGDGNVLLAKLDPDGQVLWLDSKAGSLVNVGDYYCWPTSIVTDEDGNSYVKGWHADSTYFDGFLLTNPYSTMKRYNFFIAKFDPAGNTLWAHSINESRMGSDYNKMDIDEEGNVYLGAQVTDTVWFEDDYQHVCAGYQGYLYRDLFVAKYTPAGELDWVKIVTSAQSEWGRGANSISCIAACDVDQLIIGWKFINLIELTPFTLTSQSNHGLISLLGEMTGVPENSDKTAMFFDLYPNPASEDITVRFSQPDAGDCQIMISDVSGRIVLKKEDVPVNDQVNINISAFSPGLYFITIRSSGFYDSMKFTVH